MINLRISPEVQTAQEQGHPVVALESTIITHGMPWPRNLDMAREVQETVRQTGATPATIAVLEGQLHIGLIDEQLKHLAQAGDVRKLSRADLAVALAMGWTGSTTVAATMIAARHAGISTFATGGIGGVHRGAEESFDISADLQELAQTPVSVVCAGVKAILDLPKTLEVLETLGVPVICYGQDRLPAFWSASSDLPAPLRMDHTEEIAQAHLMRQSLNIPGGQLIANPVPATEEIPGHVVEPMIQQAMQDATRSGITGKGLTPFLLSRVMEMTDGQSLNTNIALIRNNARLAAKIACDIRKLS